MTGQLLPEIVLVTGLVILLIILYGTYAKCYSELQRSKVENADLAAVITVLQAQIGAREQRIRQLDYPDRPEPEPDRPGHSPEDEEDFPF